MIKELPYKDITQVVPFIGRQIKDSLKYCKNNFSGFENNANGLFIYLKQITVFKYDPDEMELLQTAQTLFDNNWHGVSGAGDCDCFTILAIACLYVNNFTPYIILCGNKKDQPSHIYAGYLGAENKIIPFDLTENICGKRRYYKYFQIIPIK